MPAVLESMTIHILGSEPVATQRRMATAVVRDLYYNRRIEMAYQELPLFYRLNAWSSRPEDMSNVTRTMSIVFSDATAGLMIQLQNAGPSSPDGHVYKQVQDTKAGIGYARLMDMTWVIRNNHLGSTGKQYTYVLTIRLNLLDNTKTYVYKSNLPVAFDDLLNELEEAKVVYTLVD